MSLKKHWPLIAAALLVLPATVRAQTLGFSTFESNGPIVAAAGGTGTIAFTYAGTQFIGSTYYSNQLYSTGLTAGSAVTPFGSPLPVASVSVGEVVVGASLGNGGFANGTVFAGSQASGAIYKYTGGVPST